MEFTLDLHTHTVASGHAYSTVQEMAKAAADKGLKLLGITEHAQGIPGTCDEIYFHNMRIIPRNCYLSLAVYDFLLPHLQSFHNQSVFCCHLDD